MNPAKLSRVKDALRLVVSLSEKVNMEIPYCPDKLAALLSLHPVTAEYFAYSANMGASMAKALLVAIDGLEHIADYGHHISSVNAGHSIESILNHFPDEL